MSDHCTCPDMPCPDHGDFDGPDFVQGEGGIGDYTVCACGVKHPAGETCHICEPERDVLERLKTTHRVLICANFPDSAKVVADAIAENEWLEAKVLQYTEAEVVRWEYRVKDLHDDGESAAWGRWLNCERAIYVEYGARGREMLRGRFYETRALIVAPKEPKS